MKVDILYFIPTAAQFHAVSESGSVSGYLFDWGFCKLTCIVERNVSTSGYEWLSMCHFTLLTSVRPQAFCHAELCSRSDKWILGFICDKIALWQVFLISHWTNLASSLPRSQVSSTLKGLQYLEDFGLLWTR